MLKKLTFVMFLLLASCAPGFFGPELPKASTLDFPVTELIERLIQAKGPYNGFPVTEVGNKYPG